MTLNVGIYIYDEVEVLDFAGSFEVFSTASRVNARSYPGKSELFTVFTVGRKKIPICARGGLEVTPKYDIHDHPKMDLLIIPGGIVTGELVQADLISWIAASSETAAITASVCTGAFLLAQAGLLRSKKATTHWEDIPDFCSMFPDVDVQKEVRWVDQGRIVTAAGISAGIDMSLHLVSRVAGKDLAVGTARQMEFDWTQVSGNAT